jgi:hypothetical protein
MNIILASKIKPIVGLTDQESKPGVYPGKIDFHCFDWIELFFH